MDRGNTSGIEDGLQWLTAYSNLSSALEVAEAGDSIWVAQGFYRPTDGTDRHATYEIPKGVKIFGGFLGNEATFEERDTTGVLSILSGDIGVFTDSTDNCYHVLTARSPDEHTVLDRFHIRHGNSNGNTFDTRYGGGLFITTEEGDTSASKMIIRNCTFEGNSGSYGAAIGVNSPDNLGITPRLENCHFISNRATVDGGAFYRSGDNGSIIDTLFFDRCVFSENYALSGGGVNLVALAQPLLFQECEFENNYTVVSGSGANFFSASGGSEVIIVDSKFVNNYSATSGGVFLDVDLFSSGGASGFKIYRSIFDGNESTNAWGGGVSLSIAGPNSSAYFLEIDSVSFINNKSTTRGAGFQTTFLGGEITSYQTISNTQFINNDGGPIIGGGFVVLGNLGSPTKCYNLFYNCLFANNTGALSFTSGHGLVESTILNCSFIENGSYTISKNRSPDFDYETFYNDMYIYNCVFQQAGAETMRNHLLNGIIQGVENNLYDFKVSHSIFTAPDCDMPGGDEACGEGVILATDSEIVDIDGGDFRLSSCSPAIDAGLDSIVQAFGLATDLLGSPRIQDGAVDLGAFEQPKLSLATLEVLPPECPGEANGEVVLTASGIGPFSYQVIDTAGQLIASNTQLLSGAYVAVVTDSSLCQDTLFFEVPALDSINAFATIEPATESSLGSITLDSLIGGTPPYAYEWGNGHTGPSLSLLEPGVYSLSVTDANGCFASFTFEVQMVNKAESLNAQPLLVFPNPVAGSVFIETEMHSPLLLQFLDIAGRNMLSRKAPRGHALRQVDLSTLPAGTYWMQVFSQDGALIATEQIVVR
ncbi:T9SS type A sorting domain-containing protein [Phaeodactylibacter luteus]|uniref:T9SS type A sorting domain-containing protein n=1 Tax=Phaeodactylibacter luteus TaxID=1564516 RepID=UPI00147947CA|nr:T9SS type A sorting domain-containing protein [Phaeodactylibacter luteus]